jgi:ribosomal protein S12 methylthiotransferase
MNKTISSRCYGLFIFIILLVCISRENIHRKRKMRDSGVKKFNIYVSKGCSRRPLECGRYYNYFTANGWEYTPRNAAADLILVYTCGGFQKTEDQSLLTIEQALREKKNSAKLVVTGCLTKINNDILQGDYISLKPEELDALNNLISARVKLSEIKHSNLLPDINGLKQMPRTKDFKNKYAPSASLFVRLGRKVFRRPKYTPAKATAEGERFYLRIADGCIGNCSYCAIRISCGKLRSKKMELILDEFNQGLKAGYKTFVILAEDTGCYGQDIGTDIVDLLKKIFEFEEDYKLIIKDFNPQWLIRYSQTLIPLLKKYREKLTDIRMPIQSGSDRILKKMRRPYKIQDVKTGLRELKIQIPELPVYTHFMVGFAGETKEDFLQTKQLIKEFEFEDYHVYCFEARPGTMAINMPNAIPDRVKMDRKRILDNLK